MPLNFHSIRMHLAARTARLSISMKLSIAFAAVLLMGVLGLGLFTNHRAREQAIRGELATLTLLSERLAGQVDTYLSSTRNLAQHLALTQDVTRFLAATRGQRALAPLDPWLILQAQGPISGAPPGAHSGMSGPSALFVLGPDGTCLASSNPAFVGEDFGFRPYFQEARAGRASSSDWFIGAVTRVPKRFSAAPVLKGDQLLGVLVAQYDIHEVEEAIQTFGQAGRTAVLINHLGISLAHNHPEFVYHALEPIPPSALEELAQTRQFLGRAFPLDPLSVEFRNTFHQVLRDGLPRTVRYHFGEHPKWSALSRVKGQAWVVSVSEPESAILLPTRTVWRDTLLVGLLSSAAAFLLALGLVRVLLRPLRALSSAITAFGQGTWTARAPLQTHRELDQLAHTFNTMANTIQGHRENLEGLVRQRTQDLEQAIADMNRLHGMIPICSYCKKIRDDGGSWWQLESYIQSHSEAEFSHGICPDCRTRHFPKSGG